MELSFHLSLEECVKEKTKDLWYFLPISFGYTDSCMVFYYEEPLTKNHVQ